jgi:hypothetical protein
MTTKEKVARRKRSLLELATELGNVSRACRVMGYSRQQFYEIRRTFQTFGADGLLDRVAGARAPHPNRVGAAIEQAILDHAFAHPCHGPMRVAQELMMRGIQVLGRRARRLAAPWPAHQAQAAPAPGAGDDRARARAVRRADPAAGALQPRVPRAPHRGAAPRRPGRGRHLLHRRAQGGRQGLPADRDRLPLTLRLGQALSEQAADHRGAAARP